MITRTRDPSRAFTLLEVIIAIALTLALLGALFGFLFNLLNTRARALDAAMRQRAALILCEHLERDLMHCLVGDDVVGAGVEGDGTGVRLLTRGVAITAGDAVAVASTFADLQRTEYRFDESARRLDARRGSATGDGANAAAFETLGTDIFRVQFRYHDGTNWVETFDSLVADRLPMAVEVSIWHDPWPGEEEAMPPAEGDPLAEARRATFDADAGFDERREAMRSDLDLDDRPLPDHRRVFLVPDAAAGGGP